MRSVPLLVLIAVLSLFLTACPAPGPSFNFTGMYQSTFASLREITQLPQALHRALPVTITANLTQTGMNVSGTLTSTEVMGDSTVSAMVIAPGEATGLLTPPPRVGPDPIRLSLTAQLDLVVSFPGHLLSFVLERQ